MMRTTGLMVSFLLFLCAVSTAAFPQEYAGGLLDADIEIREDYTIAVDGVPLKSDVPPVEKNGVIFIPYRFAAEALNATVDWKHEEKTVVLTKGNLKTAMRIGDPKVDTHDGEIILASEPFLFESRTMIPLRAAAESLLFKVREEADAMYLTSPGESELMPYKEKTGGIEKPDAGKPVDYDEIYSIFREQARKDRATQTIRPFVTAAWAVVLLLWLVKFVFAISKKDDWRDKALIGLFLMAGVPFVLWANVMLSTYWAAIVIIGTSFAGLFSTEDYAEKLVTMGSTAQGLGLICTLFGLGLVIGPAIATHNIAAIGYGIYVKIEPTITGLSLSIIMNVLFGYEARKLKNSSE
ncbi:MAG: copper amine oxidase N-terminal domain-containing protein [bacterium]